MKSYLRKSIFEVNLKYHWNDIFERIHLRKRKGSMKKVNQPIYIFLDVDGVLNKSSQWKRMFQLDDGCISCFAKYVRCLSPTMNVNIVLTSTWKRGYSENGIHSVPIQDLVSRLLCYGIKIIGKTEDGESRTKEINEYIDRHGITDTCCIAVDDDATIFPSDTRKKFNLILVNAGTGFTEKDILRVKKKSSLIDYIKKYLG